MFLRVVAVSTLFGASIIHGIWTVLHFDEWLAAGVFFVALTVFQMVGALALPAVSSRLVYGGIIAGSVGTILVWAVSRTVGMPFGPEAGEGGPVGMPDLVASFFELLTAVALLPLLLREHLGRGRGGAMSARGYVALAAIPVYVLVLTCVAVVPAAEGHGGHAEHATQQPAGHSHG